LEFVCAVQAIARSRQDDRIIGHHHGIEYYARVFVDWVVDGWADLELEVPGPNGEEFVQDDVHTWIFLAQSSHKDYTIATFSSN
jgi:hypothetical protein